MLLVNSCIRKIAVPQESSGNTVGMGSVEEAPGLLQDPRRLFQDLSHLRKDKTIPFNPTLNAYVVTRYDDIVTILDHPEVFSSRPTVPEPPAFVAEQIASKCPLRGTLLGWDNPVHDRLRASVNSFFVPRRLKRFEPVIEGLAQDLADEFAHMGKTNIKSSFALPLPLKVVSTVAGLDPARWEWIGRSLSLFGGHPDLSPATFEDKLKGIIDLHDYIADLIQQRRTDRRDDLISHIWDERESGKVSMTDFEHLSMIPGLLLAGHETTMNLLSMGLAHLLHNNLWERVSRDDETRAAALEELLRFESTITGMRREATQQFTVGQSTFHPGDQIFVAYNSGSRDSGYFSDPDIIDLSRKPSTQHLGFGRGIHACLGAPLARLLLRVELKVLHQRLPNLKLVTPYHDLQYDHVHEGRGLKEVVLSWDQGEADLATQIRVKHKPKESKLEREDLRLLVQDKLEVAAGVLQLTLCAQPGKKLPLWLPGAHVDIPVGPNSWRQYSLCSDHTINDRWQVAVSLEEDGQGGSKYIHRNVQPGQTLKIGGPRNHFAFREAKRHLFIAGGIGITPIRSMLYAAKRSGSDYTLIYLGSTRSRMAYADEFHKDPCVQVWPKDEFGRFDLDSLRAQHVQDTLIYCCGPERLLQGVESIFAELPRGSLNIERFQNVLASAEADKSNTSFEVLLNRSGRVLTVPRDRTLLDVLNENGTNISSTCTKGTCGTCEIPVIAGRPDHRDTVLTVTERAENSSIMPCVSRCVGSRLTLDLW